MKYRSPDFVEALEKAKSKYADVYAAEMLVALTKRIFPRIKRDNYDFYEYTDGCLFHYFRWNDTNIGEYVNDNYEKGLIRLIRVVNKGELTEEEAKCAKHLLAALACVYFDRRSSITQDKEDVIYRLYSQEETFRESLKLYALHVADLISEIFYRSFTKLEKNIMELIYQECMMQYSQKGEQYSSFRGSLDFKFINCFVNLPK